MNEAGALWMKWHIIIKDCITLYTCKRLNQGYTGSYIFFFHLLTFNCLVLQTKKCFEYSICCRLYHVQYLLLYMSCKYISTISNYAATYQFLAKLYLSCWNLLYMGKYYFFLLGKSNHIQILVLWASNQSVAELVIKPLFFSSYWLPFFKNTDFGHILANCCWYLPLTGNNTAVV